MTTPWNATSACCLSPFQSRPRLKTRGLSTRAIKMGLLKNLYTGMILPDFYFSPLAASGSPPIMSLNYPQILKVCMAFLHSLAFSLFLPGLLMAGPRLEGKPKTSLPKACQVEGCKDTKMFHEADHKWVQEIDKAGTRVDFCSILRRQQGRHEAVR